MLSLTRKAGERILIADGAITVQVVEIGDGRVRLGISAPRDVSIHREEVFNELCEQGRIKGVGRITVHPAMSKV